MHLATRLRSPVRHALPLLALALTALPAAAQTTYHWTGGGSASWSLSTNWAPTRALPAATDILVFDTGTTLTLTGVPTETIGQLLVQPAGVTPTVVNLQAASVNRVLTVAGGTGADLVVAAGSALNLTGTNALQILVGAGATGVINGNMALSGGTQTLNAMDASGLSFEAGSSLQQNCAGSVFTAAGTANAVLFKSGATFTRLLGSTPFGLAQPSSKVVFALGSLYSHQQATAPDMAGRTYGNFEYKVNSLQSATGTAALSIGSLTVSQGQLSLGMTGAFSIKGDISVSGGSQLSFNASVNSTIQLNGTSAQTLAAAPGSLTLSNRETLELNNPAGLLLTDDLLLSSGTLNLLSGNVTTGIRQVEVDPGATLLAGPSGWVVGNLALVTPSSGALLYPIGGPSSYLPVTLTFGGASGGALVRVGTTGTDHPTLGASSIDPTRSVNRYWTITQMTGGTFANPVSIAFSYLASEVDPGSNFARFRVARLLGSWTTQASSSGSGSGATVSGLTDLNGDYAVGEGAVTYTWAGGSGAWTASASWLPARTSPATNDILRFVGGGAVTVGSLNTETIGQLVVTNGALVTLTTGAAPVTLTLGGWLGTDLVVSGGSALNLSGNTGILKLLLQSGATGAIGGSMTFSGAAAHAMDAVSSGAISFDSGSVFTQTSPGSAFTAAGTSDAVVFQSGSTLVPAGNGQSPFGLTAPASKITLAHGSLYKHTLAAGLDLAGRSFGNFEYNGPAPASTASASGTGSTSIDNFVVTQGQFTLGINGTCTVLGDLIVGGGAGLALNGPLLAQVTMTLGGSAPQHLLVSGSVTGNGRGTLRLNNPAGATLATSLTLSGCDLDFQSGVLSTGAATLALTSSAQLTGAGPATGWVSGNLRRAIVPSAGEASQRFDVGDATRFTPVDLAVHGLAAAFDLAARTSTPDHPALGTAELDVAHSVNRWWTLTPVTSPALSSADLTLHFDALDLDGGTNTSRLAVRRYSASTWSSTGSGTNSATSVQGTGVTGFGDFAAAEPRFTVTASAGAGGTISPTGSLTVAAGGSLAFTIAPLPCFTIADVQVDGGSVGAVTAYTFDNVQVNHTISASFAAIGPFAITATSGGGGTITPAGTALVNCGATQAYAFTPAPGFHVGFVRVDGAPVAPAAGYSFTNVQGDHTLNVFFLPDCGGSTPQYLSQWGSLGTGTGQFDLPSSLTVGPGDHVYVTDYNNHRVQKFTAAGAFEAQWGGQGSGDGQFQRPYGIHTDNLGQVFVSDPENFRIEKFTATGTFLGKWGSFGAGDGQFFNPVGLDVDAAGRVYVSEQYNHRVQVFDNSGAFVRKFGTHGAGAGQLGWPYHTAVDVAGRVFVAEIENSRLQVFDPAGQSLYSFGGPGSANGQFGVDGPRGVAIDANGLVYVADTGNDRIQVFTPQGDFVTAWGSTGTGPGQFNHPQGVAFDSAGRIYVVDTMNHRVQRFAWAAQITASAGPHGAITPAGVITVPCEGSASFIATPSPGYRVDHLFVDGQDMGALPGYTFTAVRANHTIHATFTRDCVGMAPLFVARWGGPGKGDGQFNTPTSLAVDQAGHVYVADYNNGRIQRFDANGLFQLKWGTPGSGDGELLQPYGVVVDSLGHVFVSDPGNDRVEKFTATGGYLGQWGASGGEDGQFANPVGLGVSAAGEVYVSEQYNDRVQVFDNGGAFLRKFGTTGSGLGQMIWPYHTTIGPGGQVYVAEIGNSRIQVFDAAGLPLFAWGSPGSGNGQFGVDGPRGVAVDSHGQVYVADSGNDRIQIFSAAGAYLGQWGTHGSGEGQFNHPGSVAIDADGFIYVADTNNNRIQKFACVGDVSAAREPGPPSRLILSASPNPSFGPRLALGLPAEARIELAVFDVTGRRVRLLEEARLEAGAHVIPWDGRDDRGEPAPAGMYYVRLHAGGERSSISVLLLR